MVENIVEKIELYNSIRQEIEKKIREIKKAENNARHGYNGWCTIDDLVDLSIDEMGRVVVKSTDGYENDECSSSETEKAYKELFVLTEEQLIVKFNEQYKEAIEERETTKRNFEKEEIKREDEKDLMEFKRLNKKFRNKNGKK